MAPLEFLLGDDCKAAHAMTPTEETSLDGEIRRNAGRVELIHIGMLASPGK